MRRKFKRIYIEITNVCNMNCSFCKKISRRKEFMDKDQFENILHQIEGYTEHLYFHIMGEPLLHPQLSDFLDICYKYGFKVNLTTNGTLISKLSETLMSKQALRLISFSLHSFEKNIETDTETFDSYLNDIFTFIFKAGKESDLICSLRLWNLDEYGKCEKNTPFLKKIENEFNIKISQKDINLRGVKITDRVYLNFAKQFEWPSLNSEIVSNTGFCYGLRDQIGILVDGTVVPCCLDSDGIISLGNIKNQTFSDIIENNRAKAIFDGFSSRKAVEELCRRCRYKKIFD